MGWDELVYHQALPRRWQADGWPAFYADLPYSGFPSLGEIVFWLLALLDSAIAPRLLVWVSWIIGLALIYRLLRRRLAAASAMTFVLAFAVSETALMIQRELLCGVDPDDERGSDAAGHGQPEGVGSRLREASCQWKHIVRNRLPTALILGVLGGGAAGVKLTGLAFLWCLSRYLATRARPLPPCTC